MNGNTRTHRSLRYADTPAEESHSAFERERTENIRRLTDAGANPVFAAMLERAEETSRGMRMRSRTA